MSKQRIPIFRRDQDLEPLDWKNCAIREFTADGVSVGRCMHYVGMNARCPIHGDVTTAQEHYRATGKLTNDPRANIPAPTPTPQPQH